MKTMIVAGFISLVAVGIGEIFTSSGSFVIGIIMMFTDLNMMKKILKVFSCQNVQLCEELSTVVSQQEDACRPNIDLQAQLGEYIDKLDLNRCRRHVDKRMICYKCDFYDQFNLRFIYAKLSTNEYACLTCLREENMMCQGAFNMTSTLIEYLDCFSIDRVKRSAQAIFQKKEASWKVQCFLILTLVHSYCQNMLNHYGYVGLKSCPVMGRELVAYLLCMTRWVLTHR